MTFRPWLLCPLSALILLGQTADTSPQNKPAPSGSPTPTDSRPPVTIKSTTRLVQVSVVVHNRKGEPVTDLKKGDFTLFEKGKPQQISVFSMESTGKLATPAVKLPQNIFSNRLNQRSGVPSSVTVILLDALNTAWTDQTYAKGQVVKFLEQIQPEDRVAIYSLGRGLKILHDYTTDSTRLLAALKNFRGQNLPDLSASEPGVPNAVTEDFNLDSLFDSHAESDFFTTNRVLNTLKALEVIANHLASLPGRKNLIWVSGGFPLSIGFDEIPDINSPSRERRTFTDEMDGAIRALNNAGISVYPVDARGLVLGNNFMDASQRGSVSRMPPKQSLRPTVDNLDTMEELASRTGGRAAYNTNDLKNAVRKAMEDAKVTYTLGYYPANSELDGKFRDLKIKVDRPGLDVRYRKGYFAFREPKQDDKVRKDEIRNAVWSPLDATALAINARVDLVNKPEPNTLSVYTQIDPVNLNITQNGDRFQGKIDILFVQKDEQGHEYGGGIADTLDLNFKQDTYMAMLKKGMIYSRVFPKQAKATELRIIVRDTLTGSTGSITIPYSQVKPI
jgi:VWFA-related protein